MADENDDKAQALIESLSGKMVEAILPKITESVEAQIKGISDKNDELLTKLSEQKDHAGDLAKLLAAADAQQQERLNSTFKPNERKALTISKEDARNVGAYRAAKAEAEKQGVPLQIVADD